MPAGRPLLYQTPEELQSNIDLYFDGNDKPTICGLVYLLGFNSRQSFYDYENYPEFSDTIKRARLRMEAHYESKLNGQYSSGAIFALKNFGWTDKQEISHDFKNELPVTLTIVRNGIK